MKKIAFVLLVTFLTLTMVFTLTACSSKDLSSNSRQSSKDVSDSQTSQESSSDDSSETSQSSDSSKVSDDLENTGKYATMEDYVNSEAVQNMVDSMLSSLEQQGISIVLKGDGNRLIYEYTYQEQVDAGTAAPALESALSDQSATFAQVAASLKAVVDVEDPIVMVTYRNADGSEIYSQEFTAEN